uniref:40S ribosomal protein SA n=1 Tax=Schistosoma haematobium TaxID=6185 RepID=A0A095A3Y4_SCHHA
MSGGYPVLELSAEDLRLMLAAHVHVGETNMNFQMSTYVHGCTKDNYHIIKLDKTWEKILLSARAIAAIDHPTDVYAVGSRPFTQRAVLKFANYTGTTAMAGRFTPGTFTNQKQSTHSIAVVWWLLAREVRRIRGEDTRLHQWSVLPDLFLYRDPNEEEQNTEEVDDARLEPALPGADIEAAETWGVEPTMPVGSLGDMGIAAAGYGPVGGTAGGWSNLDADPTETW